MRKIFSLGLFSLFLYLMTTPLFAGYPVCDAMKAELKDADIYGWCNAWHSADTQTEKDLIEGRIRERVDGIDIDLSWLDGENPTFCPCWGSLLDLQDKVACAGYPKTFSSLDSTGDDTGFDVVLFGTAPGSANPGLALWAGFTPLPLGLNADEFPECVVQVNGGLQVVLSTGDAQGSEEDAICREHILDVIASPPAPDASRCPPAP